MTKSKRRLNLPDSYKNYDPNSMDSNKARHMYLKAITIKGTNKSARTANLNRNLQIDGTKLESSSSLATEERPITYKQLEGDKADANFMKQAQLDVKTEVFTSARSRIDQILSGGLNFNSTELDEMYLSMPAMPFCKNFS